MPTENKAKARQPISSEVLRTAIPSPIGIHAARLSGRLDSAGVCEYTETGTDRFIQPYRQEQAISKHLQ